KFLKLMEDYADYIYKVFIVDTAAAFKTPGHEEIELALVKMYDATGKKRYLELAKHFIDKRGVEDEPWITSNYNKYNTQDFLPVRQQKTAEGHAVRAGYLYSGMADIAKRYNDEELLNACKTIFSNIVNKRMYITGGTGSSHLGEAYTLDYDLPNTKGYAETCAAIALAFFSQRMLLLDKNSIYADTVERIIYNGMLSGVSLDGKAFFYENPLELQPVLNNRNVSTVLTERNPITQRKEVFSCSCCPPNVIRFIGAVNEYIYSYEKDTLFINQFISSTMEYESIKAEMETDFPYSGQITMKISGAEKIAFRKPYWCKNLKITLNGGICDYSIEKGYIYINLQKGQNNLIFELDMTVRLVHSNPRIYDNSHKTAVMRGPLVYCAEGIDNDFPLNDIVFCNNLNCSQVKSDKLDAYMLEVDIEIPRNIEELYTFTPFSYQKKRLRMIPYYCFANRGETEMRVWL
ncbi:MAG: beta-L-arabinofuranosidase domain-containing protein, partial [Clostridia bacterium]